MCLKCENLAWHYHHWRCHLLASFSLLFSFGPDYVVRGWDEWSNKPQWNHSVAVHSHWVKGKRLWLNVLFGLYVIHLSFCMLSGMVLKKEVLFSSVPALSEHKQGLWFYRLKKIPQLQRTYYFLMHFSYFLLSFFLRFLATCAAYGVLVPQPGMEPGSGRVLTTEIAGKPFLLIFNQILLAPLVFNI